MKRGDIYRVRLNPVSGHEQQGMARPVLVVSSSVFNNAANVAVAVPITQGPGGTAFSQGLGFAVPLFSQDVSRAEAISGVIRCDQPRVLDLKSRGGKKVAEVSVPVMEEVLARIVTLFDPSDPD